MKGRVITGVIVSFLTCLGFAAPLPAVQLTVEVTNLTHGIYFTPLLVTAHDSATHLFEGGGPASASLQLMAECGDISSLLSDLGGEDADTAANPAGGLLAPGSTAAASIDTTTSGNTHLSIVAMLLPTNDGFVGLDSLQIPDTPGIYVFYLNGYDAGTEANDETASTIPGPAGGGEGFNAERLDRDFVSAHSGVVTGEDGLGTSVLDESHRFLSPVAEIVVIRTG